MNFEIFNVHELLRILKCIRMLQIKSHLYWPHYEQEHYRRVQTSPRPLHCLPVAGTLLSSKQMKLRQFTPR